MWEDKGKERDVSVLLAVFTVMSHISTHAGAYQELSEDEGENVTGVGSEKTKLTLAVDEENLQAHKSGVATLQPDIK